MSRPVRKRRLTLAREFRNSVKAGPRVWLIAASAFLCLVLLPLLSKLASLLAMLLVGLALFFIGPVILSAVLGGLINHFKRAVVFRVFTNVSGGTAAPAPMKQAGGTLVNPAPERAGGRERAVIEVETITEAR